MKALRQVIRAYHGSDAEKTKALYARLEQLGPIGAVALNLLRAQKASERAKQYRGRYNKVAAYGRKEWALDNLRAVLLERGEVLGIAWGWGHDAKQHYYPWVLYVELPTGQVSFHAAVRGGGPDYPRGWDGVRGAGVGRIVRWAARLLEGRADAVAAPAPVACDELVTPPAPKARVHVAGEQLRLL